MSRLPILAVLHGDGSASPFDVLAASHGRCEPLFVLDRNWDFPGPEVGGIARVLDVTGLPVDDRSAQLHDESVSGVTTFSEYRLRETARVGYDLGLPGHHPDTAGVLTDKHLQQAALARAGIGSTPSLVVTQHSEVAAVVAAVGLPCVVKPRSGAGSRSTSLERTPASLARTLSSLPAGTDFVAETYLPSDESYSRQGWGDYVSVESVSRNAVSTQVCVTGKFAMANGFRERGMILPCPIDDDLAGEVCELEAGALRALGVREGVTHTEIKLTPDGPRVIEVNGRLGGYVPEILRRAGGPNLVELALRVALGEPVPALDPVPLAVTFQRFIAAPQQIGTIARISAVEQVEALPGVSKVILSARPGDHVDWTTGTESRLGLVLGRASSLAEAAALSDEIDAVLEVTVR